MHELAALDRHGAPPLRIEGWERTRREILARWESVLGPLPSMVDPDHEIIEVHAEADHLRYRIAYRTGDGDRVPAFVLVPTGRRTGAAVLALHSTHRSGKADTATSAGRSRRRYGLDLVRRGHVVLAPDAITAGERIDPAGEAFNTGEFVDAHPRLSPVGKMIADHRQAVTVLATWPGVDPDRIGAIGHSLGGYNAWFLAGLDPRVGAVASSCGFGTFAGDPVRERWGTRDWFSHLPALDEHLEQGRVPFEFHEILALMAPRPIFTWVAMGDRIFPQWIESARALDQVFQLYASRDAADRCVTWLGHGAHDFPDHVSAAAYEFLDRHLAASSDGEAPSIRGSCARRAPERLRSSPPGQTRTPSPGESP